jgi:hypothetical protein
MDFLTYNSRAIDGRSREVSFSTTLGTDVEMYLGRIFLHIALSKGLKKPIKLFA